MCYFLRLYGCLIKGYAVGKSLLPMMAKYSKNSEIRFVQKTLLHSLA